MVGSRRVLHVGGQTDDLIRSIHEMIKNLQDFVAIDSWRRLGDGDGGQLCDATPGKGLITPRSDLSAKVHRNTVYTGGAECSTRPTR